MGASQIQGFTTANLAEVEANTKALRVTLRPEDYGSLGFYNVSNVSGVITAGGFNGANAATTGFSARWTQATNLCLVKRFILAAGVDATGFTAGDCLFNLFAARSFTVSDSGQTSITPSGNQNKLRTSMGATGFAAGDIRISATALITVGTRTLDANPLASACAGAAAAGTLILAPFALLDFRPGQFPLVLAQNEGLVLQITTPATGTFRFSCQMEWAELTAY